MRIANRLEVTLTRVAGLTAVCLLAAAPAVAQNAASDQRSGVAHPDPVVITASPDDSAAPTTTPAKPSAAVPAISPAEVYGPYVPYQPTAAATKNGDSSFDPDANIVTSTTAGGDDRRLLTAPANQSNNDGIVTHVPSRPGEIPEGSLIKVSLREALSTLTTKPGTKFTAEVTEPVMRDDQVVVPVGSILEGRVTWVRGGKRVGGPAAIHLEPRTVTLPDGAQYVLQARAIDTNRWDSTKVDREGTIIKLEHGKRTAAAISLATGGGLAAGAMMGGVPGALIGAGVGAGVGTAVWLKQDRQAELPKDLGVVFSLTEPMTVSPAHASIATATSVTPGGE
jgi:hypothetical protein